MYETLVEFKPGTTEIQPCLAESWEVSDDGLAFTFNLRKGVKFHDGTDFNADAVVFSLSRQFKEDHPHYNYDPWKYWGYMDMDNIIEDVVKVDDYTVKITLQKPEAPFIANLAMNFSATSSLPRRRTSTRKISPATRREPGRSSSFPGSGTTTSS